jgi:hypothetical protein
VGMRLHADARRRQRNTRPNRRPSLREGKEESRRAAYSVQTRNDEDDEKKSGAGAVLLGTVNAETMCRWVEMRAGRKVREERKGGRQG